MEEEEKKFKQTNIDLRKAPHTQIEIHINELCAFNDHIDGELSLLREKFNKELKELSDILGSKDYKKFLDLQSRTLATRQNIQESITYFMQKLTKSNSNYKKSFGERTEFYITGFGTKVNDGIKIKLVDRDLCEKNRNRELFENHIEHLRECRIFCDQIGYAVKNAVSLLQIIGMDR